MDGQFKGHQNQSDLLSNLAIVIPAFKSLYFEKTLSSLVAQTNQDFHVYISNDAGDDGIEKVVNQFRERLPVTYQYFPENRGQWDLVAHWKRSMNLIQNEEWVWILPDDDFADEGCVEAFLKRQQSVPADVYRFNIRHIDGDGNILSAPTDLPETQSSFESLIEKLKFIRSSSVAEYIFRRSQFQSSGGFATIPMAWGTDDLMWFRMGFEKGIASINDACVNLRTSHLNISADYQSRAKDKIEANFLFLEQLMDTPEFHLLSAAQINNFREVAMYHILMNLQDFKMSLSSSELMKYAQKGNQIWGGGLLRNVRRFYLNNKRIQH